MYIYVYELSKNKINRFKRGNRVLRNEKEIKIVYIY